MRVVVVTRPLRAATCMSRGTFDGLCHCVLSAGRGAKLRLGAGRAVEEGGVLGGHEDAIAIAVARADSIQL